MPLATIPIAELRAARERIADRVHRTPVFTSHTLGALAGVTLHLKCESFQKTGSFKARGALNKVLSLSAAERGCGLCTVSAGNHAQAVAWAAREVAAPCTVVMPTGAPRSKIDAVRGYGATIVFHDDRATLFDKLEQVRLASGATFVHPFDDPLVLAGAGTVGLEIVEQVPDVDVVVVPVGGGGLMGGVTCAIKQVRPEAHVVAVELAAGPGLAPALAAGKPIPVARPAGTLADGMTPPFVGALPMAIARAHVDAIVTVTEAEIALAMMLLFTRAKLYVEGAGAAATAAVLAGKVAAALGWADGVPARGSSAGGPRESGRADAREHAGAMPRVVVLVSGGNVDPERVLAAFPAAASVQ